MRKILFFLLYLLTFYTSYGQEKKEWKEGYKLTVLDFQAEAPAGFPEQGQTYYFASRLNFDYARLKNELKSSNNYNKYVVAFFIPAHSWLQQGEGTEILLKYAQMDFDLLELYARKLRKRLHTEKHASSDPGFFRQAHQQINAELARHRAEMQNAAAESESKREAFHEQVLKEIAALAEFCQTCTPTQK